MPLKTLECVSCVKMDVQEGEIPKDIDYGEDAFDFETQLAIAKEVSFTQTLAEPLCIGSHIVCTGTPTDDIQRFAVDIGCGDPESGHADIAVHFNPRFPQQYVVRNSLRHDKWGNQETTAFKLFPFKVDRLFTIEVLIDEKETIWAIDGEVYCEFVHRNPSPFAATWVQINGIRDAVLHVQKTDIFPTLAQPPLEVPTRAYLNEPVADNLLWRPNVLATIPNGIPEGHQVVIHGRVRAWLHSFAVELCDAAREWPRPNVLLHVNVRAQLDAQLGAQLVVLNAWFGGWGAERRQRTARLIPGAQATLRIVHGGGEWLVFADDVLVGELEHRAAPAGARALRIRGDLFPERVYVCPTTGSPHGDS